MYEKRKCKKIVWYAQIVLTLFRATKWKFSSENGNFFKWQLENQMIGEGFCYLAI